MDVLTLVGELLKELAGMTAGQLVGAAIILGILVCLFDYIRDKVEEYRAEKE